MINLTRTAAIEYARKSIRVNVVCPGSIATPPFLRALGEGEGRRLLEDHHPIGRLGLPEEIARVVLFLASDDSYSEKRLRPSFVKFFDVALSIDSLVVPSMKSSRN